MKNVSYQIHEVVPYINWIYFFHAWGFQPRYAGIAQIHGCDACRAMWLASFPEEERSKAAEAMQLYKEAGRMLARMENKTRVRCLFRLCRANAEGDNLLLSTDDDDTEQAAAATPTETGGVLSPVCRERSLLFPLLRQQTPSAEGGPYLCLSDFVRPLSAGIGDRVGLFASSVAAESEAPYRDDPYQHLLVQTLNDRLAEAATEKMHEQVRKHIWGYAPDEALPIPDLLLEHFQGIRPAVGYPSLPDQSVNFLLDRLLDMKQAGITLTENGAMYPHASVSGLMLAHPAARYFAVGKIGDDQLHDYARRRGMTVEQMRKFLAGSL